DEEGEFEGAFETLIRLHEARWTPQGKPGAYANENFSRFHHMLASKIVNRGWIKLFIVYISGEPIAALQVFAYDKKLLVYQSGLSSSEIPVRHPGTLIRDMAIEWSIAHGFTEWDMLRSRPGSYKLRWASHTREILGLRLARHRSKEMIYATTARVMDGLRQIRRALG
ncbi:MAG TPA: GNAT family N-acetyltransferase, partial [Blastocatellia bacterium]